MKYIIIVIFVAMIAPCYYMLLIKNSEKTDKHNEDVYHEAVCYSYMRKTTKNDTTVYKDTIKVQFKNGILNLESTEISWRRGKTLVIKDTNDFPVLIDSVSYQPQLKLQDKHDPFIETWRISGLPIDFWEKNFNRHMLEFRGNQDAIDSYVNDSFDFNVKRIYCKELK